MASRRMNIWGSKPNPTSQEDKTQSSIPRMRIPQFKTTEELIEEKKRQQHQEPDQSRPEQDPHYNTNPTPVSIPRSKRRSYSISVCVSEEEEVLLRKAASEAGMTFSGWARLHLFKSANMKIPKRHK